MPSGGTAGRGGDVEGKGVLLTVKRDRLQVVESILPTPCDSGEGTGRGRNQVAATAASAAAPAASRRGEFK